MTTFAAHEAVHNGARSRASWWCIAVLAMLLGACGATAVRADNRDPSPLKAVQDLRFFAATATTPSVTFALVDNALLRVSDGGDSTTHISQGVPDNAITAFVTMLRSGALELAVGTRESGVWRSTDGGATWVATRGGLTCLSVVALESISPQIQLAATRCNGVDTLWRTADAGATWRAVLVGTSGWRLNRLVALGAAEGLSQAYTSQGVFASADGGQTWRAAAEFPSLAFLNSLPAGSEVLDMLFVDATPTRNAGTLVLVQGAGVYFSQRVGVATSVSNGTLQLLNEGLPSRSFGPRFSTPGSQVMVTIEGSQGGLYELVAGPRWQLAISTAALPSVLQVFKFVPGSDVWYAITRRSGLWISANNGRRWVRWGVRSARVGSVVPGLTFALGRLAASAVDTTLVDRRRDDQRQLTVTGELDLAALQVPQAALFNVYVLAYVPVAAASPATAMFSVLQKTPAETWGPAAVPLTAYLANATLGSQDQSILIELLVDTDMSTLPGTEFYLGYGTSGEEMLAAQRYRGVYKVLPP
jgi:hypothetical protein